MPRTAKPTKAKRWEMKLSPKTRAALVRIQSRSDAASLEEAARVAFHITDQVLAEVAGGGHLILRGAAGAERELLPAVPWGWEA